VKKIIKFLLLVVIVFLAAVALPWLMQPKDLVPWRTDFAAARQEAQRANKPVFAYFTAAWCGPCRELKRTLWSDPKTEAALRSYVPVKVDIDANPALASQFKVQETGIPLLVVLKDDGHVAKQWVGSGISGEGFEDWLKK
jgi:thiol:disulfide interchange protein